MVRWKSFLHFFLLLAQIYLIQATKKCVQWTPKFVEPDGPSMIYAENLAPGGVGRQLDVFAMLWMLRRTYNVDVFISKQCFDTLSQVFTAKSLGEIPILDEYFCNPHDIVFEYYSGPFDPIDTRRDFRVGRTLWLWPSTSVLKSVMVGRNVQGDDDDTRFRSYK